MKQSREKFSQDTEMKVRSLQNVSGIGLYPFIVNDWGMYYLMSITRKYIMYMITEGGRGPETWKVALRDSSRQS